MRESQYRQGDVLLVRVTGKFVRQRRQPFKLEEQARVDGRLVLAFGEATGHAHAIASTEARLLVGTGRRFLQTTARCRLEHEEHDPIDLDPGFYEVIRQREYEPGGPFVDVQD